MNVPRGESASIESKGGSVMIPNLPMRYDNEMARYEQTRVGTRARSAPNALTAFLVALARVASWRRIIRCRVGVSKSKTAGRLSLSRFRVRQSLFGLLKTVAVWYSPTKCRVKTHYCLMK
jgi:hypothetical protein